MSVQRHLDTCTMCKRGPLLDEPDVIAYSPCPRGFALIRIRWALRDWIAQRNAIDHAFPDLWASVWAYGQPRSWPRCRLR